MLFKGLGVQKDAQMPKTMLAKTMFVHIYPIYTCLEFLVLVKSLVPASGCNTFAYPGKLLNPFMLKVACGVNM